MSLITDIAQYLEDEGLGVQGTSIFCQYMPENIVNGLSVIDTGGPQPDEYLPTHEPTFQIFIRSEDYPTGKAKLESVRSALHQMSGTLVGSTYFFFILALSEGGHIGRNDNGNDEFSINFHARTR